MPPDEIAQTMTEPTAPLTEAELAGLLAGDVFLKWLDHDGREPVEVRSAEYWPLPHGNQAPGWLPPIEGRVNFSRRVGYQLLGADAVALFPGERLFLAEAAGPRREYTPCMGVGVGQARLTRELGIPPRAWWRSLAVATAERAWHGLTARHQNDTFGQAARRLLDAAITWPAPDPTVALDHATALDVGFTVRMASAAAAGTWLPDELVLVAAAFATGRAVGATITSYGKSHDLTYRGLMHYLQVMRWQTHEVRGSVYEEVGRPTEIILAALFGADPAARLVAELRERHGHRAKVRQQVAQ